MSRPAIDNAAATSDAAGAARTAERLLRWYPRPWRDRYGVEFTELLMADITERAHSPRRFLDVMRGGILARLADVGLAGFPLPLATAGGAAGEAGSLAEQARQRYLSASLGSLSCALGAFLIFGAALESQILIAWQWSAWLHVRLPARSLPPLVQASGRNAFFAVFTTGAMLTLLVLAGPAALPVLAGVAGRIARGREARLVRPALALAAALAVLLAGGRHFENNWLGTGGHHAFIPSGVAAFIWAVTLFVSSYWGHPAMLATLPVGERVWMTLSPFALAVAVVSPAVLVRRVRLSPRVARFEACLGLAACVTMAAFVVCYAVWIAERVQLEPGQPVGISVGVTNAAIVAALALTLAVAAQAARMVVRGMRRARG